MDTVERTVIANKIELHSHLDGSFRHSTLWEIAKEKGMKLPGGGTLEEFKDAIVVREGISLHHFLNPYTIFSQAYQGDLVTLERLTLEYCEDAARAGIRYLETRYSPHKLLGEAVYHQHGMQGLEELVGRLCEVLRRGEQLYGLQVCTLLATSHGITWTRPLEVLDLCRQFADRGVVGIDLLTAPAEHGHYDEAPLEPELLAVFNEARVTGVHRTVHAGEASGPAAIKRGVDGYYAERIGHGYHVVRDQQLYARCLSRQIHFECCPYSSLLTGAVPVDCAKHPIKQFADDKANFSLNSDDTTLTGFSLADDYKLASSWGISDEQIAMANLNAAKSCFLPEYKKTQLVKDMVQVYGLQNQD